MMGDLFSSTGAGLPERHAKYRFLATVVVIAIAGACFFAFAWLITSWPFWAAFGAGVLILGAGFFFALRIIQWIVPNRIKRDKEDVT